MPDDDRLADEAEDAKSRLRRGLRRSHELVERYRRKLSPKPERDEQAADDPATRPIFRFDE